MRLRRALGLVCFLVACRRSPSAIRVDPVVVASASISASASAIRPPPPTDAFPCPPERVVAIDLDAWKKDLLAAVGEVQRDAVLAKLRLDGLPIPTKDQVDGGCPERPTIDAVEITAVDVNGDGRTDRVVDVRASDTCSEDPKQPSGFGDGVSRRIAVLVARPEGDFCAAAPSSADVVALLSFDQSLGESACLGPDTKTPPLDLSFEPLVDAKKSAIRAVFTSGLCGTCGRMGVAETRYLDVDGAEVRSVFSAETFHAEYSGCPTPPQRTDTAEVKLVGAGYPRAIEVTATIECEDPASIPPEQRVPCTPKRTSERWFYDGREYRVPKGAKAPP